MQPVSRHHHYLDSRPCWRHQPGTVHNNGFTLFELMLALGIMAVLSALALPSFQAMAANIQSDLAADKLYHHLNFARIESVTKNMITTVCASQDNTSCQRSHDWSDASIVVFHDRNGNGNIDTEDSIIKSLDLDLDRHSLRWRSFGNRNYLQWQPTGMTYYQNGNFTYCPRDGNEKHAKKIILNAAGRIYFGEDRNRDGIQEGTDGKNIECPKKKTRS